jgi:hypothetical protein
VGSRSDFWSPRVSPHPASLPPSRIALGSTKASSPVCRPARTTYTLGTQDLLDLAAHRLGRSFMMPATWSADRRAVTARTICRGLAAPLGFGVVAWLDRAGPLTTPRAIARQAAWQIGLTGLAG